MNKKGIFPVLVFIGSVLLSSVVNAQGVVDRLFPKQVADIFKAIFAIDASDPLGLKVLFGLFLFVLLFGVSQLVFKKFAQGVRITLAVILAIISTILVPSSLLVTVAQTYGAVFMIFLLAIPVLGGFWILTRFKEKTKFNYVLKALTAGCNALCCWCFHHKY